MLKVWGRTNSVNVQKVLWTLAELGLPYQRHDAGMKFGVVDTPAYQAMNPNALIPTIDDGGYVLWESNVIVRYLSAKYGMGTLCPESLEDRFLAERWMDWQQTSLGPAMGPAFAGLVRTPPEKRDPAAIEASCRATERWVGVLDRHLSLRAFVNGPTFSMGDIPVGAQIARWYGMPTERESRPNVERWLAAIKERPAFRIIDLPLS